MRRTIYALLLTIFVLTVSSCTKEEIKPVTNINSYGNTAVGGGAGMPGPL